MYNLSFDMDFVRSFCSSIHAARKSCSIPTSQPLQSVVLYKGNDLDFLILALYKKIISDECNVKSVEWEYILDEDYEKFGIRTESKLNFKEAGKLLGKDTQTVGKMIREGDYTVSGDTVFAGDFQIPSRLVSLDRHVDQELNAARDYFVAPVNTNSFFVLDTMIYSKLYMEKLSQEIVKLINKERRDRGFQVGDFVDVVMDVPDEYSGAISIFRESITAQAKCNLMYVPSDTLSVQTMKIQ